MRFRTILFATISGIFLPLNSANAYSEASYLYGYYWGGLNAICASYAINAISEKNATMLLNSVVKMGNEEIKDSELKNRFNKLVKTANVLKKGGCSKLIK